MGRSRKETAREEAGISREEVGKRQRRDREEPWKRQKMGNSFWWNELNS